MRTGRRVLAWVVAAGAPCALVAQQPTPGVPAPVVPVQQVPSLSQPSADSIATVRAEEALVRVRRYTASDLKAARTLADSLVSNLPPASAQVPEALFARASIAANAADAERDYTRIVNEYRFAPRVPDALMRLAVLESARSDRSAALRHLDRLLRDHGDSPARARASLLAGRLRMEANDPARACELLAAAHAAAGPTELDVKDQAETLGRPCPTPVALMAQRDPTPMGVTRAPKEIIVPPAPAPTGRKGATPARRTPAPAPAATVAPSEPAMAVVVRRDTSRVREVPASMQGTAAPVVAPGVTKPVPPAPKSAPAATSAPAQPVAPTTAPRVSPVPPAPVTTDAPAPRVSPVPPAPATTDAPAPTSDMRYAVQFAAYNTRAGAEGLATVLRGRGIAARVEGTAAPFRVRAGRYTTRTEAEAQAAMWRKPGQAAIVVSYGPTP